MRVVELPLLRATDCIAVTLEQAEMAGTSIWVVTVRESARSAIRRRWHAEPGPALAFAAEQADRHGLILLDLREPGDA